MDNSAENAENMEVTPATSEIQENIPEQPSLAEAVQESKDAISSAEPVKRRGRPKKDPNAPAKEKPKKAAESPKVETAAIPTPPPIFLKPVINFPYQALALKTGWAGWQLTEKEQEDNAVLLDAVLKRYLPQMGSEHPEAFALILSLGMATVTRYMAFQALIRAAQTAAAAEQEASGGAVSENVPATAGIRPIGVDRSKKNKNTKSTDPAVKPASGLSNFLDNGPQTSPQI